MSGIMWGIVDFNSDNGISECGKSMKNPMEKYKIDRYSMFHKKNVFFGCGIQYITEQSINEVIPVQNNNLILTCDAIIDNREELTIELGDSYENLDDLTDSQYILLAYKKWGKNCVNHLDGDFSFAIWDKEKQELFCARDHVGKRTLYYYYENNKLIFCTLIKPILENIDVQKLNDVWIADYLSITGVLSSVHVKDTMYKKIHQLPPSTYMIIRKDKMIFNKYWNPEKDIKLLKLASDKDYVEKFKEVFSRAVISRTRTCGDVGIMLSSGLDSTAVAAYAAPYLDKKNKYLKAFTSVPEKSNKNYKVNGRNTDETYGVNLMRKGYKNIISEFCEMDNENVLTCYEEKSELLEMPYKAIENFSWYTGIASRAADTNCKILLDGQYGNLTISYGELYTALLSMVRSGDVKGIVREIQSLKSKYNVPLKKSIKTIIKLSVPYEIRKKRFKSKNKDFDKYKLSIINKKLLSEFNVDKILEKNNFNLVPEKYRDWSEVRQLIVNPIMFSHVAEYETKVGLKYGVLKRDPTRDRKLIELILSFPIEQFVKNSEERILVRRATKGLVPDEILDGKLQRGIQAADWVERLRCDWNKIHKNIVEMMQDDISEHYFDKDKLNNFIDIFNEIPKKYSDFEQYELRTLISTFIFYKFIYRFNQVYS